jgi:(p)ppGpp synthase/HD superfamily hydrolase
VHVDRVAQMLEPFGDVAQCLGYLHDVKEDAGDQRSIVESDILKNFGPFIASCVNILTDTPGLNRKEKKCLSNQKLAAVTGDEIITLVVKLCDRIVNVEFCIETKNAKLFKMYVNEYADFRIATYREGLCDDLWTRLDALMIPGIKLAMDNLACSYQETRQLNMLLKKRNILKFN